MHKDIHFFSHQGQNKSEGQLMNWLKLFNVGTMAGLWHKFALSSSLKQTEQTSSQLHVTEKWTQVEWATVVWFTRRDQSFKLLSLRQALFRKKLTRVFYCCILGFYNGLRVLKRKHFIITNMFIFFMEESNYSGFWHLFKIDLYYCYIINNNVN